jgi:hypothetical protein
MPIRKRAATLLVAGAAVMTSATPALAAQPVAGSMPDGSVLYGPAPAPDITVTGTGTVSGTPDELQLSLDISATAVSVTSALDEADKAAAQVRDALVKSGVAADDLQTSDVNVQPQYNQKDAISGYTTDESLTAELHGLAKAGKVISDAVAVGGNAVRVEGMQLDLADQSGKLLTRARAQAIEDAKQRAEEYAKAAGLTLGPVQSIAENDASVPVRPLLADGAAFAAVAPVPISAGTEQVTASVTVVYQLGQSLAQMFPLR